MNAVAFAERRWLPDVVVRAAMRRRIAKRLKAEHAGDAAAVAARQQRLVDALAGGPIAAVGSDRCEDGREDGRHHAPTAFHRLQLGPCMKDSACLYASGRETLEGAEQAMLGACAERAQLADGQRVLDAGSGWGSFALWAAARYRRSTIVALCGADGQRAFVEAEAAARGLTNVIALRGDVAGHAFDATTLGDGFDRIVAVEAFARIENYRLLFAKLAGWLARDGRVFVQAVANRHVAHRFADEGEWVGGPVAVATMPGFDLFKRFDDDLEVERRWWVAGTHYQRTADDWLVRIDTARDRVIPLLEPMYGAAEARVRLARRRIVCMGIAELFGFDGGRQWGVAHYRFARKGLADAHG